MTLTEVPAGLPADHAARERIRTDLTHTLFVEAGAGTGKTTALVSRVVQLVVSGLVTSPRELAAITFTEAAAAELRDRVREQLEAEAERLDLSDEERGRVRAVLADVDEITVTTLHGFASRLLAEYPLEAGLPPGFEVEDEIEASVRFDRRWVSLVDDLHGDPELRAVLGRALVLGLPLKRLGEVARIFDDNWDRLGPPRPDHPLSPVDVGTVVQPLADALRHVDACIDPDDRLCEHLHNHIGPIHRDLVLLTEVGDAEALLTSLVRAGRLSFKDGRQDLWNGMKPTIVDALAAAEEARVDLIHTHRSDVLGLLANRLCRFAAEGAEDRRSRGLVSYHDLLVRARDLLRSDTDVRVNLARRFRYLLIDEFQDTDPLQIEIAALLADAHPEVPRERWQDVEVVPGKLFFVGDPKQSIYRFRRADIALYAQAQQAFGADAVHLTANFRSVPDVLAWVNSVFGELIVLDGDAQPEYVDLDPHRGPGGSRPAVLVVGGPVEDKTVSIGDIRDDEARELAELIRRMRAEEWEVGRTTRSTLRYDDVALLVPTRTPLGQIERALENAGVPYRIESRSLVFQTDEVRELLAVLAAIDDPADEVALVTALRSPALACSDADLADWHLAGGRWRIDGEVPEGFEDHRVAAGLQAIARLHEERDWKPVNELVAQVVRERRMVELTLARRRPRDHWRRYRFLTDAARAFVEAGGASLAEFVAWVTAQADGGADRIETVVNEPDDDAVRIMTVHGSKGLEFPVVVLAGLNADRDPRSPVVAWGPERPEIRFGRKGDYFETAGYLDVRESDQRFEQAEQKRLLYVAATRAQDHLVVSLHHKAGYPSHAATLHEVCQTCGGAGTVEDTQLTLGLAAEAPVPRLPVEAPEAAAAWRRRREATLAQVRASSVATPSGLAHDDAVPVAEEDVRVPGRGEGGTARGRAVHAVLQAVSLPDAHDLDELAALEAANEGVARPEEVAALARAALAAPVVQRGLAAPRSWRELAVVADVDGRLVEGFVDLAFEDDDGRLVVVDYKTDAVRSAAEVDAAAGRYRVQIAAYAAALEAATGRDVREGWLVFPAADGGSAERKVDLTEARAAMAARLG